MNTYFCYVCNLSSANNNYIRQNKMKLLIGITFQTYIIIDQLVCNEKRSDEPLQCQWFESRCDKGLNPLPTQMYVDGTDVCVGSSI